MPPVIHKNLCISCMTCATVCPEDAFGIQAVDAKYPEVRYPRACRHCNACVLDCPKQAVTLRFPVPNMMVYYDTPERR